MMKIPVWVICLIFSTSAFSVQDYGSTPDESQMCQKRVYSRKDNQNPDWGHMHHYCDGLRFYDRAMRTRDDKSDFAHNIKNSVDNFDYVLKHTTPEFNMRPEVMVMRGRTLELSGQGFEAAQLYSSALKINPNFSMAYAALGNFYTKSRNKEQALKVYAEGLRRSPDNRYLRARYRALGGSPKSSE